MNHDQAVSPAAVEETRREIRGLVGEIARLVRTEVEPGQFWAEFLGRVVAAMAAVGGAVWIVEDGGRLGLLGQVNLEQTGIGQKDQEAEVRHGRLVQKAFSDAKGLLVPPHTAAGDSQQAGNPTDYLLVLAPLTADRESVGVLEIFQRPDTGAEAQWGYLRFALQMCELAGDYFRSRRLRSLGDQQALWSKLQEFTRTVHTSLDLRQTAYSIANEGRRLIECDRLSVAVRRGRGCTIEAVSGQDVFEKRSNTIRLLTKLAEMAATTREPIWYTGDTRDMAPQVEEVIQQYVDQSQSKAVGVLPLLRPRAAEDDQEAEQERPQEAEPVVGVLLLERIEDSRVPGGMLERIDFVSAHGGSALANAWEHENLFLMPVWKALGKARWIVRARTLPKTLLVLAAAVALLGVLLFWPADFEMEAAGRLEPVVRRNIFAGLDGRVEEVFVDHGEQVYHHAVLGAEGTAVPRPLWAWFQDDPEDEVRELSLLVLAEERCSLTQGGVKPGDTVRARLPNGKAAAAEWTELPIRQVVDEKRLRLEDGPAGPLEGPVEIQIWRISPLARLRSTELEIDVASVTGRQTTVREQMHSIRRLLLEGGELSVEQQNRLSGQLAELDEELQSLDRKLSLYKRKQQELLVTAPADGVVMTWELRDRLIGRPVRRGQFLMQVADPEGPWQLELRMPENEVGYVRESQQQLGQQLQVTYILATDPATERTGRVIEVHRAAEVRGEEGNTVLMKVKLDDDLGAAGDPQPSAYRHAGAELRARVHCGRRSLGFVLFHDLIAFIRSRILFRL
jgi:hypothetical protein